MKKVAVLSIAIAFCLVQAKAQKVIIPEIGGEAPSFTAQSTEGKVNFPSDYGDQWKILFSHPKDFTPVCSSEILELAYEQQTFHNLDASLVVVSTDVIEQHKNWKAALEEISYGERDPVKIDFPLVADNELEIATLYGMVHSESSISKNIRGVYFIDPDNTIKAIQFYPNEVGRSVEEIKRTLVALQATYANNNMVTPVNWQPGDDVIVPVLSQEDRKTIGTPGSEYYQLAWFMVFKKTN
ncbi:MAG: redoxin domain-containing protein [Bacteroidota bacterium]